MNPGVFCVPMLPIPSLNNILSLSISESQRVYETNLKMQFQILKSPELLPGS